MLVAAFAAVNFAAVKLDFAIIWTLLRLQSTNNSFQMLVTFILKMHKRRQQRQQQQYGGSSRLARDHQLGCEIQKDDDDGM